MYISSNAKALLLIRRDAFSTGVLKIQEKFTLIMNTCQEMVLEMEISYKVEVAGMKIE